MSGFQTFANNPTQPLGSGRNDYYTPGCCPEGVLSFYQSPVDECCQDSMHETPFR